MKVLRAGEPQFASAWSALLQRCQTLHPFSLDYDVRYQREYLRDVLTGEKDVSVVIATDGGVPLCGLRAFALTYRAGEKRISCMGRPVAFVEPAERHRESEAAFGWLKDELESQLAAAPGHELSFRDYLPGGALSKLSLYLLEKGASARAGATQLIDLTAAEEVLRSGVRKSYRSLLNWGARELELRLVDGGNPDAGAFEEFRQLHIAVAGRETRPKSTWDCQWESLRSGELFLIVGRLDGRLVTGGLFHLGRNYCYYGVGASDRNLFDKPLSHAVLWKAMLHAKALGISTFEMGDQIFPSFPGPAPGDKEISIATFKRGFGGECRCVLDLTLKQ